MERRPPIEHVIEATISSLGAALHGRDASTHAHSQRLIGYAEALGLVLGLPQHELASLRHGVFLHDIGKIHVPDGILLNPGCLSTSEWTVMRRHPLIGYHIVSRCPWLTDAGRIVLAHHEWHNGSGYPQGLKGHEIPMGARVCAVVDMLDALTSHRPYRNPVGFPEACAVIQSERGTHFDPLVIDAFETISPSRWREFSSSV
jgi:HD-GYP domain-containing protein (c-di-GMP phosphodiesterase class II)